MTSPLLKKLWPANVATRYPANIYLLKVNNRNSRKRCEICSMKSFWCFYCWLWTYFTFFSTVSIVDFEQENVSWVLLDEMTHLRLVRQVLVTPSSWDHVKLKKCSPNLDKMITGRYQLLGLAWKLLLSSL